MDIVLFDRELDVMNVLWEHGPSTVAEVRSSLQDRLAYTTVLTVLRTLEEKGYARREEEGRAHRYHATLQRQIAGESAVRRLTRRLFQNSPELLLTHLMSGRSLSDEELVRMRKLLDERLNRSAE